MAIICSVFFVERFIVFPFSLLNLFNSSFSKMSWLCFSSNDVPVLRSFTRMKTCQNVSGLNALISFSLSTINFSVGPWTLPADIILKPPVVFIAFIKARDKFIP